MTYEGERRFRKVKDQAVTFLKLGKPYDPYEERSTLAKDWRFLRQEFNTNFYGSPIYRKTRRRLRKMQHFSFSSWFRKKQKSLLDMCYSFSWSKPMRGYTVWTDGSCLGNPGYGGWAAVFFKSAFGVDYPMPYRRVVGSDVLTTNNRMEMKAIIEGLNQIDEGNHVRIVTDSAYVAEGATKWYRKWIEKKWKGVANADLWHELLDAISRHDTVEFKKVRGHSGVKWNEECDVLAKNSAKARREQHRKENLD